MPHRTLYAATLALTLWAGAAGAYVDITSVDATAIARHRVGTSEQQLRHDLRLPQVAQQPVADVELQADAFTPPTGAPGDTGWLPARADAFQDVGGFNTVAVSGGFANVQAYNRLDAQTEWHAQGRLLLVPAGMTAEVWLDYLLFPARLNLSAFAAGAVEVGIDQRIGGVGSGSVSMRLLPGQQRPVVQATGLYAGMNLSPRAEVLDGLMQWVLDIEPVFGHQLLGRYLDLEAFDASYAMSTWLLAPGLELAGGARAGDPQAMRADPQAYLAAVMPGFGGIPLQLREVLVPLGEVPEPASTALLGMAAVAAVLARRRRPQPQAALGA